VLPLPNHDVLLSIAMMPADEEEDIVLASFRQQQQQFRALMKGLEVRQAEAGVPVAWGTAASVCTLAPRSLAEALL
jgi:hypothetical protein